MEKGLKKGKEAAQQYTVEQRGIFRDLVVKEHCNEPMIHELTGIPVGSMHGLCVQLGIKMAPAKRGGNAGILEIRRARKMLRLRIEYGERIQEHFRP